MMNRSSHSVSQAVPASPPAAEPKPARSSNIYQLLGGAVTVQRLASRFYQLVDELPEASRLRALHPVDLAGCAERLFEFLSGWLGGPALCSAPARPVQPRAVGSLECQQWSLCMRLALAEQVEDAELRAALLQTLGEMSAELIQQSLFPSTHPQ
jgi:hemoglobin